MIKTVKILIFLILTLILSTVLYGAEKKKIAVLKFKANNTPGSYSELAGELMEVYMYKTDEFQILERKQKDLILREHGFNKKYCNDTDCAIEVGNMLSVDLIVVGSINRLNKYTITVKIIDVRRIRIMHADSETADTEDLIEEAVRKLAERTVMPLKEWAEHGYNSISSKYFLKNYYLRGIVPGWGQLYSGNEIKGYSLLGGFILAGLFATYSYYDFYFVKRKEYENLNLSDNTKEDYDRKYKECDNAQKQTYLALGIVGTIYLINWIDLLFFSKPDSKLQSSGIAFYNSSYNFNIYNTDRNTKEIRYTASLSLKF